MATSPAAAPAAGDEEAKSLATADSLPRPSTADDPFASNWWAATQKFRAGVAGSGGELITVPVPGVVVPPDLTDPPATDHQGAGPPPPQDLSIDFGVWRGPPSAAAAGGEPSRILLYTAGQHGVEGYTGSAIMIQIMDAASTSTNCLLDPAKLPPDSLVVFVHVCNPYGMSWWRRWNERNVDLNRNLRSAEEFTEVCGPAIDTYRKYDRFINPARGIPGLCDCFLPRLGCLIAKEGFNSAKQALAGGQGEFPRGLFFAGRELEQTPALVLDTLRGLGLSPGNRNLRWVFHVDIHTGVGPWMHDSLLCNEGFMDAARDVLGPEDEVVARGGALRSGGWHYDTVGDWVPRKWAEDEDDEQDHESLQEQGETKQGGGGRGGDTMGAASRVSRRQSRTPSLHGLDSGTGPDDDGTTTTTGKAAKDGVAYTAKGEICGGLFHMLRPEQCKRWVGVTQEFGTLKGIKIVKLLRAENAAHHADPADQQQRITRQRKAIFDAFCPASREWREFVLKRGAEVFRRARAAMGE